MTLKDVGNLCGAIASMLWWLMLLWALIYGVHFQIDGVPHLLKLQ